MKKYLVIVALCIFGSLQSMEQQTTRIPVEWNAQDYDDGNKVQITAFCHFLEKNNVSLKGKVLSVGSGTGNVEKILAEAQDVELIDGFDPSKNMVNFANHKHAGNKKLRFYQSFAEELTTGKLYDSGFASFSLHWFEDKPLALQQIYKNLKSGSNFFFTAHTSDDPKPLNLIVAEEIMSATTMGAMLDAAIKLFSTDQSKAIGSSYSTRAELKNMVEDAGFTVITCEQQSHNIILKDRAEVEAMHRPIVMSRPVVQYIPSVLHPYLFSKFIDLLITKLKKTDQQEYIDELITTIVHVQKK